MCSRYSIASLGLQQYATFQRVKAPRGFRARWNASPEDRLPIITGKKPDAVTMATWGVVPVWFKDTKKHLINARAETIGEKPTFRAAAEGARCIVPADGFFEWGVEPRKKYKQPYYIHRRDGEPFGMAGLYTITKKGELEFVIITVDANRLVAPIHNRMPAILPHGREWDWLADAPFQKVMGLLAPAPVRELEAVTISTLVNNPQNDTPDVLKPLK